MGGVEVDGKYRTQTQHTGINICFWTRFLVSSSFSSIRFDAGLVPRGRGRGRGQTGVGGMLCCLLSVFCIFSQLRWLSAVTCYCRHVPVCGFGLLV